MKEQLTQENRQALALFRFSRAEETLAEVPFLQQQGYYNTAINRLYYACYYAAVALLITEGIAPNTHAGVKQMLGMHFVASGRLSREVGRYYSLLFYTFPTTNQDFIAIGQRGGKEVGVAALGQAEALAQVGHGGREVAHGEVGLAQVGQEGLQLPLAKSGIRLDTEGPARKGGNPTVGGVEMAVGMEFIYLIYR